VNLLQGYDRIHKQTDTWQGFGDEALKISLQRESVTAWRRPSVQTKQLICSMYNSPSLTGHYKQGQTGTPENWVISRWSPASGSLSGPATVHLNRVNALSVSWN